MDVGGTKVALRAEAEHAPARQASFRWGSPATVAEDLALFEERIAALIARWPHQVRAVGVAMPATLDGEGRVVVWPSRPSWAGLDFGASLARLFPGIPVRWADDGDLAALAEADAADVQDLLYLGVGTGVGGGLVVGGRPVPDPANGSCELGHLVVDRAGPTCVCGRAGCLQAIASGPATLRRAAASRGQDVSFPELRAAWDDGVAWAVAAVDETCAALAVAAAGISELVRPACVVLGGGFAAGLPGFADAVARHLRALAREGHPTPPLRLSTLGGLSSLRGAALLARRQ
ncbi:ROK family protein [Actinoalloteichus caeruleus]|uniref:ROK family protein n=2 Tax=Actinoalloteichus cyanogriseus TaxID=2893586 RepID=UPI0023428B42|nr:ROK family protein [Actinoalloteichus caeruleus]